MSELLIFLLMIVIFAGSCFFLKLPVGIALLAGPWLAALEFR